MPHRKFVAVRRDAASHLLLAADQLCGGLVHRPLRPLCFPSKPKVLPRGDWLNDVGAAFMRAVNVVLGRCRQVVDAPCTACVDEQRQDIGSYPKRYPALDWPSLAERRFADAANVRCEVARELEGQLRKGWPILVIPIEGSGAYSRFFDQYEAALGAAGPAGIEELQEAERQAAIRSVQCSSETAGERLTIRNEYEVSFSPPASD